MELTLLQLNEAKVHHFTKSNINLEIGDILIMIGHDNDLNRFEKYCDEIIGSGTEMIFSQKFISSSH